MRAIEFTGKTVEEAVETGLKSLGLSKTDVDIKIISNGSLLKKAKIQIILSENDEKNAQKPQNFNEQIFTDDDENRSERILEAQKIEKNEQNDVKNKQKCDCCSKKFEGYTHYPELCKCKNCQCTPENNCGCLVKDEINEVQLSKTFLQNLFNLVNIKVDFEVKNQENTTILELKTDSASELIGHHGETMQALQTVLIAYLRSKNPIKTNKIFIDIENYRENHNKKIEEITKNAIQKVVQTAKPVSLDYMNAFERHLAHEIVLQDGRVTSISYGKEPRRFVKIYIK